MDRLVGAAVGGHEASHGRRSDVVGIGYLVDQHLRRQPASDGEHKLPVRAGYQTLDKGVSSIGPHQLCHHLPGIYVHNSQALRRAQGQVQEVAIGTESQVVGVVRQHNDASILLQQQVNVAQCAASGRRRQGITFIGGENDRPHGAVSESDAVRFNAGSHVEDVKG